MRDLIEAIDGYTAAHSVTDNPISFTMGQTPIKSSDSATVLPHTGLNTPVSKVNSSTAGRGSGGGVGLMNDNRRCTTVASLAIFALCAQSSGERVRRQRQVLNE